MKKIVGRSLLLLLLGVVAFGTWVFSAFWGLAPLTPVSRLGDDVVGVTDGFVQAFIVPVGEREALLIDCTADAEAVVLKAKLAEMKRDVSAIFVTHGHGDHVAGCKAFPQAKLHALEADRPLIEGQAAPRGPLTRWSRNDASQMHRFDQALHDGEVLRFQDVDVKVFALPGHTAGSAAFLIKGVLFLGDSVGATKEGTLREAPWMFTDDSKQCRESVQALGRQLKTDGAQVSAMAFSHSGALVGLQALNAF